MTVFAKVASTRSFSGAARELGISQATASKHVQTLEDWLGVRLLHRTTRRVALTDVGESFFVQCTRILEEMETARCSAKPEAPVRGSMRITAPVVFGSTRLGPLVVDFMHQHPDLSLNVELSDRSVDLIEEGYDLAIRTSPTTGAGLIAWPLMSLDYVLCAAPSYLARHGVPTTPTELSTHHCITGNRLSRRELAVSMGRTGKRRCRSTAGCRSTTPCCDAMSRVLAPVSCFAREYLVENDFANNRLVRLLAGP